MALTAFTSRLGKSQGRVRSEHAAAGEYLFVLGDQEPGRISELTSGDHADILQRTDLTGAVLVRAHLRLRVPAGVPAGLTWEASILIDGTKRARVRGYPGGERVVTDLAANVSKLSGEHDVAVRLELVAA